MTINESGQKHILCDVLSDANLLTHYYTQWQYILSSLDIGVADQSMRPSFCSDCFFGKVVAQSRSWYWLDGYKYLPPGGFKMPSDARAALKRVLAATVVLSTLIFAQVGCTALTGFSDYKFDLAPDDGAVDSDAAFVDEDAAFVEDAAVADAQEDAEFPDAGVDAAIEPDAAIEHDAGTQSPYLIEPNGKYAFQCQPCIADSQCGDSGGFCSGVPEAPGTCHIGCSSAFVTCRGADNLWCEGGRCNAAVDCATWLEETWGLK